MFRPAFAALCLLHASSLLASETPLQGFRTIEESLPWFDAATSYAGYSAEAKGLVPNLVSAVTSLRRKPLEQPMEILLSRSVYPAEDGHLDVVVRLRRPESGRLRVSLSDAEGREVSHAEHELPEADQLFFSYRFPASFAGKEGTLKIRLGENEATAAFRVTPAVALPKAGRVAVSVPNPLAVTLAGTPMTVGIPFPAGVLASTDHLRLVDSEGRELPLQARETARWSRFGTIRWVLCDFTLDLRGAPRELFLEYGPEVRRAERTPIRVTEGGGFPEVDAGWLRIGKDGIRFRDSRPLLTADALLGAFVEGVEGLQFAGWGHRYEVADEGAYLMDDDAPFVVEESGPEKVVLRTEGDYRQQGEGGKRFCRYLVRYEIFRDSPLIRIFHTWIYTGDGNRDPIRSMGWRFPFAEAEPSGILTAFGAEGEWRPDYYLRQEHYNHFTRYSYTPPPENDSRRPAVHGLRPARPVKETGKGGRAPGVMAARQAEEVTVCFGVKGFWQNFPSSLMQEKGAMTFFQWPKYGAPRTHGFREDDDIWRLWFAHEGEVLSFRLPMELTEGSVYRAEAGVEPHIAYGRPESVNAQGIAKTAEMWLIFGQNRDEAARALESLNAGNLRAVVDPRWIMRAGVYPGMTARDESDAPEDEATYELNVLKPMAQVERMGLYGKWIYGDLLRAADLEKQTASLYRTFRKAHWGWPYAWLPFARSGDLRFYPFAEAATRMMSDVAFCHYVSDDVEQQFRDLPPRLLWMRGQPFRAVGWHNRNLIPWAGYWGPSTRLYVDKADYLWQAYYLTGYQRARDVALTWAEQTKIEQPEQIGRGPITAEPTRSRWAVNLQKQYLETYQATFDPWFLVAAHAIAEMHVYRWKTEQWKGHPWSTGPLDFQRYTGAPEHGRFVEAFARNLHDWQNLGWANEGATLIPAAAIGWELTGDPLFARRALGLLEAFRQSTYADASPEYFLGYQAMQEGNYDMLFTSFYHQWYPYLPSLRKAAAGQPAIPPAFTQTVTPGSRIFFRKSAGKPLELRVPLPHELTAPDGSPASASPMPSGKGVYMLAADAPEGVYTVTFPESGSLLLPITPPDTPEVIRFGQSDRSIPSASGMVQYVVGLPPQTSQLRLRFDVVPAARQKVRQLAVWTPEGELAWSARHSVAEAGKQALDADIAIPSPSDETRLWRISLPGLGNSRVTLDPALPPYLSTSPDRWFLPDL